ncbi:MAG: hypothetical protein M4579_000716 [Chaenotheca gracillima]|nr:MAG: hypothetical protein M4579_000716 [Chaenotheca gracillima]
MPQHFFNAEPLPLMEHPLNFSRTRTPTRAPANCGCNCLDCCCSDACGDSDESNNSCQQTACCTPSEGDYSDPTRVQGSQGVQRDIGAAFSPRALSPIYGAFTDSNRWETVEDPMERSGVLQPPWATGEDDGLVTETRAEYGFGFFLERDHGDSSFGHSPSDSMIVNLSGSGTEDSDGSSGNSSLQSSLYSSTAAVHTHAGAWAHGDQTEPTDHINYAGDLLDEDDERY